MLLSGMTSASALPANAFFLGLARTSIAIRSSWYESGMQTHDSHSVSTVRAMRSEASLRGGM